MAVARRLADNCNHSLTAIKPMTGNLLSSELLTNQTLNTPIFLRSAAATVSHSRARMASSWA